MKVCMLAGSHNPSHSRIFAKETVSLLQQGHGVRDSQPLIANRSLTIIEIPETTRADKIRAVQTLIQVGHNVHCDVYHCHELHSLVAGVFLKQKTVRALVYDAHEDYAYTYSQNLLGLSRTRPILERMLYLLERFLCKYVDCVITVDDVIRDRFRRWGVPAETVANFPRLSSPRFSTGEAILDLWPAVEKNRVFVYTGMGIDWRVPLIEMALAIRRVKKRYPSAVIVFVGKLWHEPSRIRFLDFLAREDIGDSIIMLGPVPHQSIPKLLARANVGLCLNYLTPYVRRAQYPVKLMEYMAAGLPVIATDTPLISKLIRTVGCGIPVQPTPDEIAHAMHTLLESPQQAIKMGQAGRKAFLEQYNWEIGSEPALMRAYELALKSRRRQSF